MAANSDGRRIARAEKEVQLAVAQYVLTGLGERMPGLVTISSVRMTADLRAAKVFVSVLGSELEKEQVMEILQHRTREIQSFLADQLRMRYCPKLTFFSDKNTENVLKVEKILRELQEQRKLEPDDEE